MACRVQSMICFTLRFPAFIPVTATQIGRDRDGDDNIDVAGTMLAQVVQILMFAPTEWYKEINYSKPNRKNYTRRYPTPEGHGGDCRNVTGKFSLEDFYRSIILLYLALYRRTATNINIYAKRAPGTRNDFLGYFDVERQKPIPGVAVEAGPAQSAVINSMKNPLPQLESPDEGQAQKPAVPRWVQWLENPENDSNMGLITTQKNKPEPTAADDVVSKRIALQTLYVESICARQERLKNDGSDLRRSRPLWKTLEGMTQEA